MQSCSAPTPSAALCARTDHATKIGSVPPLTPHVALQRTLPPATPKDAALPPLGFPIQQDRVTSRLTPKSASNLTASKFYEETEALACLQRIQEQQDLIICTQGKVMSQMDEKDLGFRRWVELVIHQKQGELWMQLEQHHTELMSGLATQFKKGPSPNFEKRSLEIIQKANLKPILRSPMNGDVKGTEKDRRRDDGAMVFDRQTSRDMIASSKLAACASIYERTRSNRKSSPSSEVMPVLRSTGSATFTCLPPQYDEQAGTHARSALDENAPKYGTQGSADLRIVNSTDNYTSWQTAMNGLNLPASWPSLHERMQQRVKSEKQAKKPSCIERLVASIWFETLMAIVILANLVSMFLQLEYREAHLAFKLNLQDTDTSWLDAKKIFELTEYIFCTFYVVELLMRFYAFGLHHFYDTLVLVDTTIVVVTSIETYLFPAIGLSADSANLAFARIVRLARIARIIKVIRFAESFAELRIIIRTVAKCSRALVSSMFLLSIVIIAGGILMVQILIAFMENTANDYSERMWAYDRYGSASKASYSMFEATFTPFWATDARRMIEGFDALYAIFWCFWAVAINFAVMHVVAALFLKQTMVFIAEDADRMELQQISKKETFAQRIRETFMAADSSGDGHISMQEFEALIFNPSIHESFQALDLELFEVVALFKLLADDNGEANCEEFLQGAMRLKNSASTIDAIQILHMITKLQKQIDGVAELVIVAGLEGPDGFDNASPRGDTSPILFKGCG